MVDVKSCVQQQHDDELARARREAAAYKWGYEYLQMRMQSIHRYGWAQDCDGEIQARIADPAKGTPAAEVEHVCATCAYRDVPSTRQPCVNCSIGFGEVARHRDEWEPASPCVKGSRK